MAEPLNEPPVDTIFLGFRIATLNPDISNELESAPAANLPIENLAADYGAYRGLAIGVRDGLIDWIRAADHPATIAQTEMAEVIQGQQRWLTPGLIDCHTHLVYGGNRSHEWEARLNGKSYEEIARQGGGILSSVRATREASEEELSDSATRRLKNLVAEGVTTVEIKSGYGLNLETELKMLRAAARAAQRCGVDLQATLLAAHATPPEFKDKPDAYLDLVCQEIIPAASSLCAAVDAFCESIAFDVTQTKRVLQAGRDAGLNIKVHAEQLSDMGMAAEAARMGALSADHLEYLSADDCKVLAEHNTVATLLPGAFYCLQETQKPPVAALRDHGVSIAVATDANPGSSPITSLLTVGNMACNLFGLTPSESLLGMTCHAAKALGLTDRGQIKAGNVADFAVWDIDPPAELFYQIGGRPCVAVYKRGHQLNLT